MPRHNENKLSVIWDKRQKDFVVKYPRRCDGAFAIHHLCNDSLKWIMPNKEKGYPHNYEIENFVKELEARGYDLTTLRFSIELKEDIH